MQASPATPDGSTGSPFSSYQAAMSRQISSTVSAHQNSSAWAVSCQGSVSCAGVMMTRQPPVAVPELGLRLTVPVAGLDPATHVFLAAANKPRTLRRMGAWLYVMTSRPNGTLYVGTTVDLPRRAWEHREGVTDGFTKKYGLKRLVYAEGSYALDVPYRATVENARQAGATVWRSETAGLYCRDGR